MLTRWQTPAAHFQSEAPHKEPVQPRQQDTSLFLHAAMCSGIALPGRPTPTPDLERHLETTPVDMITLLSSRGELGESMDGRNKWENKV